MWPLTAVTFVLTRRLLSLCNIFLLLPLHEFWPLSSEVPIRCYTVTHRVSLPHRSVSSLWKPPWDGCRIPRVHASVYEGISLSCVLGEFFTFIFQITD